MRIAVIADIHGNMPALEAVLADIQRRNVGRMINLGDCVSGPLWPREVCDLLGLRRMTGPNGPTGCEPVGSAQPPSHSDVWSIRSRRYSIAAVTIQRSSRW
jgi:Calcineurin-like phosphoesterase superfamily domain